MKFIIAVLWIVAAFGALSQASDVVILTDANFDSQLSEGVWFVEFYAPWCGHCKSLAPTWEELATELKGKIHIGKVDCTVEKGLATRFGIRGFPTLKAIDNKKVYTYLAERSVVLLKAYAEGGYLTSGHPPMDFPAPGAGAAGAAAPKAEVKASVPSGEVVVLTEADFDAKTASGPWLLEFYAPWCGHCKSLEPIYKQVAAKLAGKVHVAKIDATIEKNLGTRFGIRGFPTVKFLFGGKLYDYASARTLDAFVEFVEGGYKTATANAIPEASAAEKAVAAAAAAPAAETADGPNEVVTLTALNFDKLTASGKWLLKFYVPWCGHCRKLAPAYSEAAKSLKGHVNVGEINCQEPAEKPICARYKVEGFPTIAYQEGDLYYDFEGDRSAAALHKFAAGGFSSASSHFRKGGDGWQAVVADYIAEIEAAIHINIWFGILICFLVGLLIGIAYMIFTLPVEAKMKGDPVRRTANDVDEQEDDETVAEAVVKDVKKKATKAAEKMEATVEKVVKQIEEKTEGKTKASKDSPVTERKTRTPKAH